MDLAAVWESQLFSLVILPLLIVLARIADVSLGTLRIVYVSRGMKHAAPIIGFFEVLIWILAIGQIMQNLTNWVNYIAYAGGFATGTYVGIWLEQKLAVGVVSVRIITRRDASSLLEHLDREKYGITSFAAYGVKGKVRYFLTVINREELPHMMDVIRQHNPNAFVSVEDIRAVSGSEVFDLPPPRRPHIPGFQGRRKGK